MSSFEDSMSKNTGYSVKIYNIAKGGLAKEGNDVKIILPSYESYNEEIEGLKIFKVRGVLPRKLLELLGTIIGIVKPNHCIFFDPVFCL